MIASIRNWCFQRPYLSTGAVFLIVSIIGAWRLSWGEQQFGFLLLLYFIVALGIRLDEIMRAVGGFGDAENLAAQLREIQALLRSIQSSLEKLPPQKDLDDPPSGG
jgi:hypothetical protein